MNRYQLSQIRFFEIVKEYLQTRNVEILNLRFANEFGIAAPLIKSQVMVYLNEIVDAIDFQPSSDFIRINNNTLFVFGAHNDATTDT